MSNTFYFISVFANAGSFFLALLGLYFVIENWRVWNNSRSNIIKAKAFLNKKFLEMNWIYLVVIGSLIVIRIVFRIIDLYSGGALTSSMTEAIFDLVGFIVISMLILVAYQWYKLIHDID